VSAPTAELPKKLPAAETYRRDLGDEWLDMSCRSGKACVRSCRRPPQLGAGGATSFVSRRLSDAKWTMSIQRFAPSGFWNSVLPHEITHTIFRHALWRPTPAVADEGAHDGGSIRAKRPKQDQLLIGSSRPITHSVQSDVCMRDYPRISCALFAGYSLARYSFSKGKRKFRRLRGRRNADQITAPATRSFTAFNDYPICR